MNTRTISRPLLLAACALVVFGSRVEAQLGNNNPTGVAGQYYGSVQTGRSYDPATGNASFAVTDVALAAGASPLAFTRFWTSRYNVGVESTELGQGGNWRHNFQWSVDTFTAYGRNALVEMPRDYTVNYPDGRRVRFVPGTVYSTASGIAERFRHPPSSAEGTYDCYLHLSDGSTVWFRGTIDIEFELDWQGEETGFKWTTVSFEFAGLIDPHNLVTTVSYPGDGSMTVSEPAGRWLKLFYKQITHENEGPFGLIVLDRVVGSDGRVVHYRYWARVTENGTRYAALGQVHYPAYPGHPAPVAYYDYEWSNVDANARPLLSYADDPMFPGPMGKIAYDYVPLAAGVVHRQIKLHGVGMGRGARNVPDERQ